MLVVSNRKKFIFIHNAKAAGTSLTNALVIYQYGILGRLAPSKVRTIVNRAFTSNIRMKSHITAKQLKSLMHDEDFDAYYKFGFVRNPWDLVVSLYKFILKDSTRQHYSTVSEMKNFDEFVVFWCKRIAAKEERLQKDYFYDGERNLMNYIGHFESLAEDFSNICDAIKLKNIELKHKNSSRNSNDSFLQYYNDETLELVAQAYNEDITLFNYSLPHL